MPRVLLAWECGGGRGHVLTLKRVAESLGAPRYIDASLHRMEHADLLSGVCSEVFPGAGYRYDDSERKARGGAPAATFGEFLADLGFRDPAILSERFRWWQDVIKAQRAGLLIGDFSPCAQLAGRSLGIPVVGIGIGYHQPPAHLAEFPVLLPQFSTRVFDEQEMVDAINEAGGPLGIPRITHLAEIHAGADQIICCPDILDPYASERGRPNLPPIAEIPDAVDGPGGDEIFAYFSTTELENENLVEALETLGLPLRIYAAAAPDGVRERLAGADHLTIERAAIPINLVAQRSRVIIYAAQTNTCAMALSAGLVHVAFPQHLEQRFTAFRAREAGVLTELSAHGMSAADIRAAITEAYHARGMRDRAKDLARRLRPQFEGDLNQLIRQRLDDVMMGPQSRT